MQVTKNITKLTSHYKIPTVASHISLSIKHISMLQVATNRKMKDIHIFGFSLGAPDLAVRSGCKAFTTMLMFGRKSASYCTHRAATAASCFEMTQKKKGSPEVRQMSMKFDQLEKLII